MWGRFYRFMQTVVGKNKSRSSLNIFFMNYTLINQDRESTCISETINHIIINIIKSSLWYVCVKNITCSNVISICNRNNCTVLVPCTVQLYSVVNMKIKNKNVIIILKKYSTGSSGQSKASQQYDSLIIIIYDISDSNRGQFNITTTSRQNQFNIN